MAEDRHVVTDGIILKSVTSNESNRYFTFISPTLGVQSATAFGAAKLKSRFCSSVLPFVKARFFLYKSPKTNFFKLEDIADISTNDFIRADLKYIYLTSFFSEIFLTHYISNEEFKSYFYLLLYSIEILSEKKDIKKAFLFFTSKIVFLSGYKFHLANCKECEQSFDEYFFDPQAGGILCGLHSLLKRFGLSKHASVLWNKFIEGKYMDLKGETITDTDFFSLLPIIIFFIEGLYEKKLKTLVNIKEIFNIL